MTSITSSPLLMSLNPSQKIALQALMDIIPSSVDGNENSQVNWVTTRDIANVMQVSIYKARHVLLELVESKFVIVSDNLVKKSLRWYPSNQCFSEITMN